MRNVLRVLPYLLNHRGLAFGTIVAVVLVTLASLLAPWPMKILVDSVLGDHELPRFLAVGPLLNNTYLLMLVVVAGGFLIVLLQNALNVFRQYVNTRLKLGITLDFRGDLFQHAQRLSLAFHDQHYSGKLVYLLNNQSDAVAGLIMTLPTLAQSLLTFVGMLVVVVMIDSQLALASLLVIPFLFYSVNSYAVRIHGPLNKVKDLEGQTLSMIQEAIAMLRVVVAFGREKYEWQRFREQGEEALDARVDVTLRQTLFELTVNLITAAGMAFVVGLGATHILRGTLTIGELLVVMAYISSVYQSLGTISSTIGSLQDQVVSIDRAFGMLDTEPDVRDREDAGELPEDTARIEFHGVHFRYGDGPETLKGVTFQAEPGEFVAIIGPTGAGKTTLVSLIPRYYDATLGRITISGEDIREFTLQSLRQRISIVEQHPILFVGTIAENILYGRLDASREEVVEAARAARIHEAIMKMPRNYDTLVGERGATLSGGERQRISIARAFLKNAPILVLDEPTAFVDSRTEADVLDALRELRRGRTTFMVSHRMAAIRDADRILVMQDGRIVEQGSHRELCANEGPYRKLGDIAARRAGT